MFVTLRYGNGKDDDIQCIESTTKPPHEEPANPHLACNTCRSKKVCGVPTHLARVANWVPAQM
jgi:hypothetical protein